MWYCIKKKNSLFPPRMFYFTKCKNEIIRCMSIWYFRFWCLQHIFSFPLNIYTGSHVISIALHNLHTDKTGWVIYTAAAARSTKHDKGLMGPVFHLGHIRPV